MRLAGRLSAGTGLLGLTVLPSQAQPLVEARLGGQVFQLELVADPESRRQGLMGRTLLPAGTGMLFDFPPGTSPAIWMRNMQIPLDLLFVDEQGQLLQVFSEVPPCTEPPCAIYRAQQPLRFVIEVPAGTAGQLNLQPGDRLDLGDHQSSPAPSF